MPSSSFEDNLHGEGWVPDAWADSSWMDDPYWSDGPPLSEVPSDPGSVSVSVPSPEVVAGLIDVLAAQYAEIAVRQARITDLVNTITTMSAGLEDVLLADPMPADSLHRKSLARRAIVAEIAAALQLSERTVQTLIGESSILHTRLPDTYRALCDGVISYRHAQKMIEHTTDLDDAATTEFERKLLPSALNLSVAKFAHKARTLRERLHPVTVQQRHAAAVQGRCVEFVPDRDGMAWVGMHNTADVCTAIYNATLEHAHHLNTPDEGRTVAQLQADVFAEAMMNGFTNGLTDDGPPAGKAETGKKNKEE